jgi:hypothetical protein
MHIVLLASDGRSPTEIARVLFCSRTTVKAVVARFVGEGQAAFFDRHRRGPKSLVDESANERIERSLEEESPVEHGWLRSRWSCKLLAVADVQRASPPHEPGNHPPRASSPGLSLEKAATGRTRERLGSSARAKAGEAR